MERKKTIIIVDVQPGFVSEENRMAVSNLVQRIKDVRYDAYVEVVFSAPEGSIWERQMDWTFPEQPSAVPSEDECAEELRALLIDAVRLQLRAAATTAARSAVVRLILEIDAEGRVTRATVKDGAGEAFDAAAFPLTWTPLPGLHGIEAALAPGQRRIAELDELLLQDKVRDKLLARDDLVYWPGHGGPVLEPQRYVRALAHHRIEQVPAQVGLQLQQQLVLQDRFMRIASHDLRNPLSAVTTGAAILVREPEPRVVKTAAAPVCSPASPATWPTAAL